MNGYRRKVSFYIYHLIATMLHSHYTSTHLNLSSQHLVKHQEPFDFVDWTMDLGNNNHTSKGMLPESYCDPRALCDALDFFCNDPMYDLYNPTSTTMLPIFPSSSSPCRKLRRVEAGYRRPMCQSKDCTKFARGSGRCNRHGGGKRCVVQGCDKPSRKQGRCFVHLKCPKGVAVDSFDTIRKV